MLTKGWFLGKDVAKNGVLRLLNRSFSEERKNRVGKMLALTLYPN